MLITVTTTSQTLDNILTPTQISYMDKTKFSTSRDVGFYSILIQNLGANNIFIDFGTDALVTEGIRIKQGEIFTFTGIVLANCSLVSETAINNNVRIISN